MLNNILVGSVLVAEAMDLRHIETCLTVEGMELNQMFFAVVMEWNQIQFFVARVMEWNQIQIVVIFFFSSFAFSLLEPLELSQFLRRKNPILEKKLREERQNHLPIVALLY